MTGLRVCMHVDHHHLLRSAVARPCDNFWVVQTVIATTRLPQLWAIVLACDKDLTGANALICNQIIYVFQKSGKKPCLFGVVSLADVGQASHAARAGQECV